MYHVNHVCLINFILLAFGKYGNKKSKCTTFVLREDYKKTFRRHVPFHGGFAPPPSQYKSFSVQILKIQSCLIKNFFVKAILLYYTFLGHPYSMSAESNNKRIKKIEKIIDFFFLSTKGKSAELEGR